MRHVLALLLAGVVLCPYLRAGAQQSGRVRAADRFLPGATVTARHGEVKVVAFTDENGRYSLDLTPGVWAIQVEMFGFTTVQGQVTVDGEPGFREWTLEMPRLGESAAAPASPPAKAEPGGRPAAAANPAPAAPSRQPNAARPNAGRPGFGPMRNRGPAGGPPERPGFQSAAVTATADGQQALAEAAEQASAGIPSPNPGEEAEEAFLVSGSTSGGLAAAGDDEARRQRMANGRGGPGGLGGGMAGEGAGAGGLGVPPGMSVTGGDSLGLGVCPRIATLQ